MSLANSRLDSLSDKLQEAVEVPVVAKKKSTKAPEETKGKRGVEK